MVVARLSKLREQIDTARIGLLVVGESEALNLLHLASALVRAVQSEESHWMNALVEADALGEEADRILPEKPIKDRDLSNLRGVSKRLACS